MYDVFNPLSSGGVGPIYIDTYRCLNKLSMKLNKLKFNEVGR